MSYITRNANLLLLFLVVLAATFMVGATVYYQQNFDNLNAQYSVKLSQLNNVSKELEQYQATLNKIKADLQLRLAREEEFTEKYTEVRGTKESLEQDKSRLLKDKADLDTSLKDTKEKLGLRVQELNSANSQIETLKGSIAGLESTVSSKSTEISSLKSKVNNLEDDVDDLEDEVSCLRSKADGEEGTC
ncbi:hypothetical protein HY642_02275 [Candidatus Woesearchaeota archaeon]|nr:hypothetical protein [Candidatus Woesearchaeota archaeon]